MEGPQLIGASKWQCQKYMNPQDITLSRVHITELEKISKSPKRPHKKMSHNYLSGCTQLVKAVIISFRVCNLNNTRSLQKVGPNGSTRYSTIHIKLNLNKLAKATSKVEENKQTQVKQEKQSIWY